LPITGVVCEVLLKTKVLLTEREIDLISLLIHVGRIAILTTEKKRLGAENNLLLILIFD